MKVNDELYNKHFRAMIIDMVCTGWGSIQRAIKLHATGYGVTIINCQELDEFITLVSAEMFEFDNGREGTKEEIEIWLNDE